MNLQKMTAYIINEEFYGKVEANVCVIEFQKCVVPHAHFIFFLRKSSKTYRSPIEGN